MSIADQIKAAQEQYDFVGLRTVEAGHDPLEASNVWADGEVTGDRLDGISATDVNEPTALAQHSLADRNHRVGYYFGECTYIIAGNHAERGEDLGEIIVHDAIVIAQVRG